MLNPIGPWKAFAFLLSILALPGKAAPARFPPVKVLEDVPGRLRIEILSPPMHKAAVAGGASGFRMGCDGCQSPAPGAPDLPVLGFEVITGPNPPKVVLTVLESEPLPVEAGYGAVVPVPRSLDTRRSEYRRDPALYAAASRPEAMVREVRRVRGIPLRSVVVPLVMLSPDGGGLTVLRRLVVEVTFPGSFPRAAHGRIPPGLVDAAMNPLGGAYLLEPTPRAAKTGARRVPARLGERFFRFRVGDRSIESMAEDQVYAVSFEVLASKGADIRGGVRIDDLRLYTGSNDSLPQAMDALPSDPGSLPGALREIPVEVVGDGNGTFDAGDTLKFFGHGTSLWKRIPSATGVVRYEFAADPWTYENGYFLGYAGGAGDGAMRLLPEGSQPASDRPETESRNYLRAERETGTGGCEEGGLDPSSGLVWHWHLRSPCSGGVGDTTLHAGQLASPSTAVLADRAPATGGDGDSLFLGFQTFPIRDGDDFRAYAGGGKSPLSFVGSVGAVGDSVGTSSWYSWRGPGAGSENFRIDSLVWLSHGARRFEGYTVSYPRRLVFRGQPLWIFPGSAGTRTTWQVEGGAGFHALRVEDGVAVRMLTLDSRGRFTDSLPTHADARYLIYSHAVPLPEGSISAEGLSAKGVALRDLSTGDGERPEYLIITPRSLLDAALGLRDFRRDAARARPLRTSVVLVDDIYREFSGGRSGSVGIRDFLRWACHRWDAGGAAANPLKHVLLFGGGNYDYRGIDAAGRSTAPANHIPPYEGHVYQRSAASDDFYVKLDSGETAFQSGGLDLALGRLPLQTLAQAKDYLDKIRAYENPALAGEWRSRMILAADDHLQRGKPGGLDGISQGHTNVSERMGRTISAGDPGALVEKVYLLDYPMNSSFRKPQATQDLIAFINQGALVVNYIGHGSENQWADEVLLQTADGLSSMRNPGRTGMVNSFACAVGRYDSFVPGMSQTLVTHRGAGAIAALSATRESYPDVNVALGDWFYSRAFPGDSASVPVPIGEALGDAKNFRVEFRDGYNDAKYNLLGEPVLLLRKPKLRLAFSRRPDTLHALDCGALQGTVAGGTDGGWVNLKIIAGSAAREYDLPEDLQTQYVEKRGNILFEQTVPVKEGRFTADYLIPTRISYGDSNALITAFAWDGTRELEGSMSVTGLRIKGRSEKSPCADGSDGQGPAIRITGCEKKEGGGVDFPERVRLPLPYCLQIHVEDSLGGVISAQGPDEGTTVEVPGILDPYHPKPGLDELNRKSYQMALDRIDLPPGSYVLKVSAQDGYGNRSLRQLRMDLSMDSSISALTAYNVPNPVKRTGTAFYFSTVLPSPEVVVTEGGGAREDRVEFEIRIFDQAGRLAKALRNAESGVRWDGRDDWGNRVANGVYFYTVTARWNLEEGALKPAYRTLSTRRNTLVMSR